MDIGSADRRLQQAFKECHNARSGHMGAEATWKRVNELYPGNAVTLKTVKEFIKSCPICQKDRIKQAESLPPMYRTVKAAEHRHVIGIERLKGFELYTEIDMTNSFHQMPLGPLPRRWS